MKHKGFFIVCEFFSHLFFAIFQIPYSKKAIDKYIFFGKKFSGQSKSRINNIETIKDQLALNDKKINIRGIGKNKMDRSVKISKLTHTSSVKKKYGRLLYKIVALRNPNHILELGTSFGISAMYIAAATNSSVITVEGCENRIAIARQNIEKASLNNIEILNMDFLSAITNFGKNNRKKFDFVFIDGDHQYVSTLKYFNMLKPLLHERSLLILDDIHESPEMNKAWKKIKDDDFVTISFDIFQFGLLLFIKTNKKKHYRSIF